MKLAEHFWTWLRKGEREMGMKEQHYFRGWYQTNEGKTIPYRLRICDTLEGNVSPFYHCELIRSEHETPHQEIVRQAYEADLPWTREVVYFGELVAGIPKARLIKTEDDGDTWEFHPPEIFDLSEMIEQRADRASVTGKLTWESISALMRDMA